MRAAEVVDNLQDKMSADVADNLHDKMAVDIQSVLVVDMPVASMDHKMAVNILYDPSDKAQFVLEEVDKAQCVDCKMDAYQSNESVLYINRCCMYLQEITQYDYNHLSSRPGYKSPSVW